MAGGMSSPARACPTVEEISSPFFLAEYAANGIKRFAILPLLSGGKLQS